MGLKAKYTKFDLLKSGLNALRLEVGSSIVDSLQKMATEAIEEAKMDQSSLVATICDGCYCNVKKIYKDNMCQACWEHLND